MCLAPPLRCLAGSSTRHSSDAKLSIIALRNYSDLLSFWSHCVSTDNHTATKISALVLVGRQNAHESRRQAKRLCHKRNGGRLLCSQAIAGREGSESSRDGEDLRLLRLSGANESFNISNAYFAHDTCFTSDALALSDPALVSISSGHNAPEKSNYASSTTHPLHHTKPETLQLLRSKRAGYPLSPSSINVS